jgi:uridine kinase
MNDDQKNSALTTRAPKNKNKNKKTTESSVLERIESLEFWMDSYKEFAWDTHKVEEKLQEAVNHKFIEVDVFLRKTYKDLYKIINDVDKRVLLIEETMRLYDRRNNKIRARDI